MERRKLKNKKNPKQPTELPLQPRRAEGRPREIHVECCNFFFFKILFPSEGREEVNASNKQILADQRTNRPNQRQKSTERFLFHPENRAERPDGIREVQWIPRRVEWIRFRTCNGQRRGAMLPAPNHAIHTVRNRVTNQICHLRTHGSSRERGHYETTGRAAILGRMLAIRKAHDWGRSLRTRTQLHTKSWLTFAGRLVTAYVHLARPAKPSDTVCDWNTKAKPGKKKKTKFEIRAAEEHQRRSYHELRAAEEHQRRSYLEEWSVGLQSREIPNFCSLSEREPYSSSVANKSRAESQQIAVRWLLYWLRHADREWNRASSPR